MRAGSLDFILQRLENACRTLTKEATVDWDGLGQGGDMTCKKIGALRKHCCMNPDTEILRARGARLQERRVRNKERLRGRYAPVLF